MKKVYAGTYTKKESKGIYCFDFDDGVLKNCELLCEIRNPKYLCRYENKIIAVNDFEKGAGVSLISDKGEIIDSLCFEDATSCYVTADNDYVYTANYHEGSFSVLKIENNKFTLIKNILIKEKCGCHQVLLYKDLLFVPCLFLDKVMVYDKDLNKINEIVLPEGSGPRHGVFSKDGRYLYLVSELSNELFMIDMNDYSVIRQIAVLDNNETHVEGTAAIRMNEDEKYLYVSTRYKNRISVIDVSEFRLIETVDCGGDHPRDFIIIDDYLLCGNMNSNSVICFGLKNDGRIKDKISEIAVPEVISLCI